MSLRDAWEANAADWGRWARTPGHDSYWRFHRRHFLALVPPPGRLTVDVGCGEGRVARDLARAGHRVVGVDGSPTLAGLARRHDEPTAVALADAAALPLRSRVADLVVAFMVLQDVDDLTGAVAELGRVVEPGGRLCLAVVHPINSAGRFAGERDDASAPFVISGSYVEPFRYVETMERRGLTMTFHSDHHTIEDYSRALEGGGFVIDALREVADDDPDDRWHRLPMFLDLRAVRR